VIVAVESNRRERPGKVAIMRAAIAVIGERGYEGASTRDMAARAGVSVAALYHHFPSKLHLLAEFLDEAYNVLLHRINRRFAAAASAAEQLDAVVDVLIASYLHDDWARSASNVAWREYTRLDEPERRRVHDQRNEMLTLVEGIVRAGVTEGTFATDEPREAARAILILCCSLNEPFDDMRRSLPSVIALYQRFAAALVR
jgi:AcrR family transcriptional regulator